MFLRYKLFRLKRLYEQGRYLKVAEKIKKYRMANNNNLQYVWYCSRRSCGAIVTKTSVPYLKSGVVYQCRRCLAVYSAEELVYHNKHNIRKYIESIDKFVKK